MLQKKYRIACALILFNGFASQAQLTIQSGANFVMEAGVQVTVQGNVTNAGTIINDGTLKVQSNYINSGTYGGTGTVGVLELYGSGNSDVNAGSSSVANLVINKTVLTDIVKLAASLTVTNTLTLTNGVLTTDPIANPAFFLISPASATYAFAPGKEIVGSVKRTNWSGGSSRIFNATNMQVITNGGTAPTDVTVTMIPLSAGGDPTQVEREVKRKFIFNQTGGSGFTADVRYPYLPTELNTNVEANIVPWTLTASEWNAKMSPVTRDLAADYVSTTGISAAQLAQEWKLADPIYSMNAKAFIKGSWNNPTGVMRTTLNSNAILPLTQPYTIAPFSYPGSESVASIPNANVVDWVLVEIRKPGTGLAADATPPTAIGRKAGFLLSNGNIVDLDGVTPVQLTITKQGSSNFIVVRHRNHLAAMSLSKASNATGDFSNDFSSLANVYQKPGATSIPVSLLSASAPGNTQYGMWPGDVNNSGSITPSDITPINSAIGGPSSGNLSVYNVRDANLDRNVTPSDVSVVNSSISAFAQTSSGRLATQNRPAIRTTDTTPVSHVPGETRIAQ